MILGVGQFTGEGVSYTTAYRAMSAAVEQPAEAKQPTPQFSRGSTKDAKVPWYKLPCRDSRNGEYYESEILSRDEVLHELRLVGFQGKMVEDFAAISLAESGRQVSCIADENLVDWKWDVSYGVWAIRAVKAEQGKGTCRDIERLKKNDFHDQTVCAFEISGQGKTFQPWSVTHAKRGKPYLKYMGQ
jgi:hypothetical protein